MQLPEYIPIKTKDNNGNDLLLIMSSEKPYYIGKVVQFQSNDEMLDWIARTKVNKDRCICGQVPGYSILVVYNGCLDRNDYSLPESSFIFKQMAIWYGENKIQGKGRYRKYLQTN